MLRFIDYEYLVIGAGIFGAAFATTMAREGKKVLLIERDLKEPDRIVGELLQPGGLEVLKKLNLEDALENIDSIQEDGYAIFFKGKPITIPYTKDENNEQYHGRSFHHGRFITNLRNLAKKEENITIVEGTVNKLIYDKEMDKVLGVQCKVGEEIKMFFSSITVIADGCFSKFRKGLVTMEPETTSHFVGFILKNAELPYKHHGHVVLGKTGPILLYQISTPDTRVLIDIAGKLPSISNGDLKSYLLEKVLSELPKSLQSSFKSAVMDQKPRVMPNSFLPPTQNALFPDGLIMAGDAMNMRHPLTGGGMTIAFQDILTLKDLLESTSNQKNLKDLLYQFHWKRKSTGSVINILANALYALFQAEDDPNLFLLQEGCFEYFKLGGICVDGPINFLSGIDSRPYYLTYHFFRVCLYAQYLMVVRSPFYYQPIAFIESFKLFFTGCRVILPLIIKEFKNIFVVSPIVIIMLPYFLMVVLFALIQYSMYSIYK
ncbi:SE-domain-containing protein [Neoconidiobolus thromboides FSU 785]|nr:SE-domain-containing protein [Neoconidiobolus thromboides FSU 785]